MPVLFYNVFGFIGQKRKRSMMSIGQTLAEIWRFNSSPNGGRPSSCIFNISKFLTASTAQRGSVRHRTKYRGDQSNRCRDIASFFSKRRPSAILEFQKCAIFDSRQGYEVNLRHFTKFRGDRSNPCTYMASFFIFQNDPY